VRRKAAEEKATVKKKVGEEKKATAEELEPAQYWHDR
jgi:hypothetical protein